MVLGAGGAPDQVRAHPGHRKIGIAARRCGVDVAVEVLVAVTLNGIPIDVLAERLNTTRGALYKTLHDARKKLRIELAAEGFDITDGEREHDR